MHPQNDPAGIRHKCLRSAGKRNGLEPSREKFEAISIRPRRRGRGNRMPPGAAVDAIAFQSAPGGEAGGNPIAPRGDEPHSCFNPPPAVRPGETVRIFGAPGRGQVSIRPQRRGRGKRSLIGTSPGVKPTAPSHRKTSIPPAPLARDRGDFSLACSQVIHPVPYGTAGGAGTQAEASWL